MLQPNNPPYADLLQALEDLDVGELDEFVASILEKLHVEMFVYGDWTRSDAIQLSDTLKDALRVQNQSYEESLRPLIMLGKNGSLRRSLESNQEDSAIVVYYQCEDIEPRNTALYLLANHLMSATFFS